MNSVIDSDPTEEDSIEKLPTSGHAKHIEHYNHIFEAARDYMDISSVDMGLNDEDLSAYLEDNPYLERLIAAHEAITLTLSSKPYRPLSILKSNRLSEIPKYADSISREFVKNLGRQPDLYDIKMFTILHSINIASATRLLPSTKVQPTTESSLCNGVTARLIEDCDPELLCASSMPYNYDETKKNVDQMLASVNPTFINKGLSPISPDFVISKITVFDSIVQNVDSTMRLGITEHASTPEITKLHGEQNRIFAHQIQKLRQYGIKLVSFDISSIAKGIEAVYDEPKSFKNITGNGGDMISTGNVLAAVRLVDSEISNEDKFVGKSHPSAGEVITFEYKGTRAILTIDGDGELYIGGLSSSTGKTSLKAMYNSINKSAAYEDLRANLLVHLFDSIAPATLIERIQHQGHEESDIDSQSMPESSDAIYDMMLPRHSFLQQSRKDVVRDFKAAELIEHEHRTRNLRLHDVIAHLRRIPPNASPSQTAINLSHEMFGSDYELPEGYTFVRAHERGDAALGIVIGHLAAARTVQIAH